MAPGSLRENVRQRATGRVPGDRPDAGEIRLRCGRPHQASRRSTGPCRPTNKLEVCSVMSTARCGTHGRAAACGATPAGGRSSTPPARDRRRRRGQPDPPGRRRGGRRPAGAGLLPLPPDRRPPAGGGRAQYLAAFDDRLRERPRPPGPVERSMVEACSGVPARPGHHRSREFLAMVEVRLVLHARGRAVDDSGVARRHPVVRRRRAAGRHRSWPRCSGSPCWPPPRPKRDGPRRCGPTSGRSWGR